jgi:hypothetical protein
MNKGLDVKRMIGAQKFDATCRRGGRRDAEGLPALERRPVFRDVRAWHPLAQYSISHAR